ncbi:low molecular weight protein-tyrosine-phosphatase [Ilyomonas limi]|nr:low molecular weight phosphotyrosine protein phosphatase [Ilyomonas limi]
MKVLMVCLGNICRSPLAEGILKYKAKNAGLNWIVESAGTGGYHTGEPPHRLSQKVAKLNGVDICDQRARLYKRNFIQEYDKIYVMDSENYNEIKRISGNLWDPSKVDLLLNELYPGENRNVQDPWYGAEPGYHEVYHLIDKACDNIIQKYGTKETV